MLGERGSRHTGAKCHTREMSSTKRNERFCQDDLKAHTLITIGVCILVKSLSISHHEKTNPLLLAYFTNLNYFLCKNIISQIITQHKYYCV